MDTDRLIKLLLFLFAVSLAATIFLAYAFFIVLPNQRVIAQTGGCGVIYTVEEGDTLAGIASECGVSLTDLQAFNPNITDADLEPGQVLGIPQALAVPAQQTPLLEPTALPTATMTPGPLPTLSPDAFQQQETQPTSPDDQAGGGAPGSGDDQVGGGAPGSVSPQPQPTQGASGGGAPSAAGVNAQGFTYTVRAGDTLSAIAARYGVVLQALINANPQISNPNLIYPGDVINVPGQIPPTGGDDYIVQPGDTLSEIALRFGVSLAQLLAANPQITNPNLIYPGQSIAIPDGGSIPPTGGDVYIVRAGDTLASIARRFGITLGTLLAANPGISDPDEIYPGQQINIPGGDGNIPPTGGDVHIVQPGDTLYGIAQLYGTSVTQLLALNPQITDPDWIIPGQVIQIP